MVSILHVFNRDFVRLGILSSFISLTWQEFYQDIGKLTIVASDTKDNIGLLRQGNIIYHKAKDTAMIIRCVKYNSITNEITAYGVSTLDLILQRIIWPTVTVTNGEAGLYKIVNDNLRGMPYVTTAAFKGFTEIFDTQVTGKLFEGISKIAAQTGLGFKMVFDYRNKRHVFTVYKGITRISGQREPVPVIFSEEFMNLQNMTITDDMSVFANVAYVFGAGEGEARKLVVVGNANGLERYELYVDARDLQPNQDESVDSARYEKALTNRGIDKLNEHIRIQTFKAEVTPADFRVKYDLGDEITCKSERYGIRINTRIMAYTEVTEKNMTTLTLTLGNPEIDVIKEVKINAV